MGYPHTHPPLLFGLDDDPSQARAVAERLGTTLGRHEVRRFADGEVKVRPLESVRRRDVFVLGSVAAGGGGGSVNDALCRALFFVGALRDAGAASVTVVAPYLGYSRKDRRTKPRDPVTSRYVAQLFEALGLARLVTLEAHKEAALENAFRCPVEHLDGARLFAAHLAPGCRVGAVTVLSPDAGGVVRAARLRRALGELLATEPGFGVMEKHRSGDVVTGDAVVGPVEGRTVVIYDDLISSGGTLARAARACKARGAHRVVAAAAHGLFGKGAADALGDPALDRVVVSSSVAIPAPTTAGLAAKLEVVDAAPLFAHAIGAIHAGGSVTESLVYL